MKGTQGLIIAASLAVVGMLCNWFYITNKAVDLEKEAFIYVKRSARIRAGDRFKKEHFGKVEIPRKYVGNLKDVAVLWESLDTVVGKTATRSYPRDRILLHEDLATPPSKSLPDQLNPDEEAYAVLVNPTVFVPENHNPGELISFIMPRDRGSLGERNATVKPGTAAGPFRILRIGSRGGSLEVARLSGRSTSRSNVITIPLTKDKKDNYDPKSQLLMKMVQEAGGQGLEVKVESARKPKKEDAGR